MGQTSFPLRALTRSGATDGQFVKWDDALGRFIPATVTPTTPAGSGTELQFRNGAVFGGAAQTTWDVTNSRLGLWQPTPLFPLDVVGNTTNGYTAARFSTNANTDVVRFDSTSTLTGGVIGFYSNGVAKGYIGVHRGYTAEGGLDLAIVGCTGLGIEFWTNGNYTPGTNAAFISSGGLFSINKGIATPGAQLHVKSVSSTTITAINEGATSQSVDMHQWNPAGVTAGKRARITSAGEFSNLGASEGSEQFGAGSTVSAGSYYALAIGNTAAVGASAGIAVGAFATANAEGTSIGYGASSYIGSIAIGSSSVTGNVEARFVAGGSVRPIDNVFFGKGVTHAAPISFTINGTGGLGTNIVGGDVIIAPGKSTGSGTPGVVKLQGTATGGSGTTPQTLTDVLTVTNNVTITLADAVNVVLNATTGTKWATAPGQKQAWWGAAPVVQQVLATGAGATVDAVISLLQTLGLCKQA